MDMSKPSFGRRLFLLIRRHPLRLIIFMMSLIGSILGIIIFLLVMPDLKCLKIERAGQDYERQLLQLVVDGLSESVIKDANPEDIGFLTDHNVRYCYRLRNIGKRSCISPNA